jgi:Flp pilus assembly protein TadD
LSNRQWRIVGGFTIFIATFICYWPAMHGDFIWDDDRYVSQNPTLKDAHGLERIWFHWGATPQFYPMTHTSFWIEYRYWQLDPLGYHITNVLLHGTNALLLWLLLRRLAVPGAWLAAAIFALHPVNVESVVWISERKNCLAMFFALLSLLAYLREDQAGYVASLVFFICAMLSKTVVAPLPAVMLVIIWWKRGVTKRDFVKLLPFFVVGIGMGVMTAVMERNYVGASGADWDFTLADRVLIAGRAVWFYAGKIVWPVRLTFSYPRWGIDSRVGWQWIFPVGVVVVLIALALSRKRQALAAIMIFCGVLFPALGFINTYPMRYSFVADHFQYMAAPALIALIAGVLRRSRLASVIVLCILATLTWRQAHVYAGPETIWRDTIAKNPQSWLAKYNLGVQLSNGGMDEKQLTEALTLFDQVQALRPQHEKLQVSRGDALAKLGRFNEALAIFQRELEKMPHDVGLQRRVAATLDHLGRSDAAIAEYRQALNEHPDDANVQRELGELFLRQNRPAEALPLMDKYVTMRPDDADAHATLGFVYAQLQRYDDAKIQFETAMRIDPQSQRGEEGLMMLRQSGR